MVGHRRDHGERLLRLQHAAQMSDAGLRAGGRRSGAHVGGASSPTAARRLTAADLHKTRFPIPSYECVATLGGDLIKVEASSRDPHGSATMMQQDEGARDDASPELEPERLDAGGRAEAEEEQVRGRGSSGSSPAGRALRQARGRWLHRAGAQDQALRAAHGTAIRTEVGSCRRGAGRSWTPRICKDIRKSTDAAD